MSAMAEQDWLRDAIGGRVVEFYSAIGVELRDRGADEAAVRCFARPETHAHDDRDPSCSVNLLSGLWNCLGCGERGNAFNAAVAVGYTEQRAADLARQYGLFMSIEKKDRPRLPGERDLKRWRHALRDSPAILRRLEELKGWTSYAIVRLGVGWDGERLTFPVRDQKLKIVGLVRYLPGGSPKSLGWPGGRRDLFPAPELIRRRHPVFLVEGEPDAISVRSCGFHAVGVPGAGSWRREWALRFAGRRIVVLPDCDTQGRALAARIASDLPEARVVDIDPSREDGYDIGSMVLEARNEGGLGQMRRVLERLAA